MSWLYTMLIPFPPSTIHFLLPICYFCKCLRLPAFRLAIFCRSLFFHCILLFDILVEFFLPCPTSSSISLSVVSPYCFICRYHFAATFSSTVLWSISCTYFGWYVIALLCLEGSYVSSHGKSKPLQKN